MKKYIIEIAGKDSVSAAHNFIRQNEINVIVPSIVYIGTEYGNFESYKKSIAYLSSYAKSKNIQVANLYESHDEVLWNLLCAKYQYHISQKYGFYTPCIMCHLFAHLIRIPLYTKICASGIITGERYSHNGSVKLNQHLLTIKCFQELFNKKEIVLIQPLLDVDELSVIENEIMDYKDINHINDVKCILSGNMHRVDCDNDFFRNKLSEFLYGFVVPIGEYIANSYLISGKIQYNELEVVIESALF